MKKFISTWFGIGIYDSTWYEPRMQIFENITLPSIENVKEENLYWLFFVDSDMPVKEKKRMINLVEKSQKRSSIYLLEIRYYYEMVPYIKKFVTEHTEESERVVLMRIDADDAIEQNFFDILDQDVERIEGDALVTYPKLWYYQLDSHHISLTERPFMALNMALVTNNRSYSMYEIEHPKMGEWAKTQNITVNMYDSETPYFIRTMFKDQDSNAYEYFGQRCAFGPVDDVFGSSEKFYSSFGLNENTIVESLTMLKTAEMTGLKWDYRSNFIVNSRLMDLEIEQNKKNYISMRKLSNYDNELRKITNIEVYPTVLFERYNCDDLVIFMAAQDEVSRNFNKYEAFLKKLGMRGSLENKWRYSYVGIFDLLNDSLFEETSQSKIQFQNNEKYGFDVSLTSAGFNSGRTSSILINGIECSQQKRGLNVVIYSRKLNKSIDRFCLDMYSGAEKITRAI